MTSPKGFPVEGRREDLTNENINLKPKFTTVTPMGQNRRALDVNMGGYYEVAAASVVEVGSTSSRIVITGHGAKKGDLIRILTSSNGIEEQEMFIEEVIDANTFDLAGDCSAEFAAGDTIDIYRFVTQKLTSDGSSTATLTSPPIQINVTSGATTTATTVLDDQDTPANTVPIPVRLHGVNGTINVTSDDLNVQLSHSAASPDSVQIGDGTEIMLVNAAGEATVRDGDAIGQLTTVNSNLDAIEVDLTGLQTSLTNLEEALSSIGTDQLRADIISSALPSGAATETTLLAVRDALQLIDNAMASVGTDQIRVDVISSALPSGAATDTQLQGVRNAVELIDNAMASVATDQIRVDIVGQGGLAQQTTLNSVLTSLQALDNALTSVDTDKLATESDQLPAALGQTTAAASLSVVPATDAKFETDSDNVIAFAQLDYSGTNITTAAYETLIGDIGATAGKKVIIFHSSGTPVYLATGAAASETDRMIVIPGGFNHPVEIELAANARLSLKAIGSNITSGQMIINVLG